MKVYAKDLKVGDRVASSFERFHGSKVLSTYHYLDGQIGLVLELPNGVRTTPRRHPLTEYEVIADEG